MEIKFSGVWLRNDKDERVMNGYIVSNQIVLNFNQKWIPDYQRERLMRRNKIYGLKKIFSENKVIDSVKLHLKGQVKETSTKDDYTLSGELTILDGQQRITALYETGVENYVLPVELYINCDREKLIERFRNYNGAGTLLSMGDYVASFSGPMARLLQKAMKERDKDQSEWSIPINRTGNKYGLSAATGAALLYWCHYHMKKTEPDMIIPKTRHIKNFLDDKTITERETALASFGLKNLCNMFTETFGTFDHSDISYKRIFFMAFNLVVVRNLMLPNGSISNKRFSLKIKNMRKDLFNTARFKELLATGVGDPIIEQMYDLIIQYFNRGLHDDRLPKYHEVLEQHEEIVRLRQADMREKRINQKNSKTTPKII